MVVWMLNTSWAILQATRLVSSSAAQAISMSASSAPARRSTEGSDAVALHAAQVQAVFQVAQPVGRRGRSP
jgi:hypothetical protein